MNKIKKYILFTFLLCFICLFKVSAISKKIVSPSILLNNGEINYDDMEFEPYFNLAKVDIDGDGVEDVSYISNIKRQYVGACSYFGMIEAVETHVMYTNNDPFQNKLYQTLSPIQLFTITAADYIDYDSNYRVHEALSRGLSAYDMTFMYAANKYVDPLEIEDLFNKNYSQFEVDETIKLVTNEIEEPNKFKLIKYLIKTYGGPYIGAEAPSGSHCATYNAYTIDPIESKRESIIDIYSECRGYRHGMQLIGWDDNYEYMYCGGAKHTFNMDECDPEDVVIGKGAWILRNSWGTSFTFPYLSYDSFDNDDVNLEFLTKVDSKANQKWNYYFDVDNDNLEYRYVYADGTAYLSLKSNFEVDAKLEKVKLENIIDDTNYQIYFSENGTDEYILLTQKNVKYAGFTTFYFDSDNIHINKNSKFKIVADKQLDSFGYSLAIFTSELSDNSYIKTNDYEYKAVDNLNGDGTFSMRFPSRTYNIPDAEHIEYAFYDQTGTDITDSVTVEHNGVGNGIVNALFTFHSFDDVEYVMVDSIYNNDVKSTSKIILNNLHPVLTLDYNDGTDTKTTYVLNPNEEFIIPDLALSRLGYSFIGWFTQSEWQDWDDPSYLTNSTLSIDSNTTLYAMWEGIDYNIKYIDNAIGKSRIQSLIYDYEGLVWPYGWATPTGYLFDHWNTLEDDSGTSYYTRDSILNLTSVPNDTINFYAILKPISYTITFHDNLETNNTFNQSFTYDDSANLLANSFINPNYLFIGWNTKSDGTGTSYNDKESVLNLATTDATNIDLYAMWQFDENYVKGDLNSNHRIDLSDIISALKLYLNGDYISVVDMDDDNTISLSDIISLLKLYLS